MVCGTGSDVGKSVLAAGICRLLTRCGLSVAPFKSQNMALNSAVTPEGGEIGRAQAVQAKACRVEPHTDMNPVLLKPNSETGSQVIVQGNVIGNMKVSEYTAYKPRCFEKIRESFQRLQDRYDFIVIEGAGSIAEINLREHDIANLKVAEMADCPAILVADIDRGGVFAQIVGTIELLTTEEKARIAAVVINKFRGDASLLDSGIEFVVKRTGVPVLGVVPYFTGFCLPEEDSVALTRRAKAGVKRADKISVGVVRLPHISNYTDFNPLEQENDVNLFYIDTASDLQELDLLILPGSKSVITDLLFLKDQGLFKAIQEFSGKIAGICGGFQMLGKRIIDPYLQESEICETDGLGLLDAETIIRPQKQTHLVTATLAAASKRLAPDTAPALSGYEIHMGETTVDEDLTPFANISSRSGKPVTVADGAVSADGRIFGTYLHGLFDNHSFRTSFLNQIRRKKGLPLQSEAMAADPFDLLADHLEQYLDMNMLYRICGISPPDAQPPNLEAAP